MCGSWIQIRIQIVSNAFELSFHCPFVTYDPSLIHSKQNFSHSWSHGWSELVEVGQKLLLVKITYATNIKVAHHELYSEPTFSAPQLYLLRHTLIPNVTNCDQDLAKETAFLVRIFHVFLWTCSKLEHGITRKAGWIGLECSAMRGTHSVNFTQISRSNTWYLYPV